MTAKVVTATETESTEDVLKRMRSFGVRRIPIVDGRGGLQGLITFDDFVEYLQEQVTDLATLLARERRREADVRPAP